ncbi:hypothetical protein [uncultured Reyranella sp.]|uniref:hypothetical protein n=1 Tax=uncultured Reyranella sp. TaxID=735512 RepID=UPI0025CCD600|nr:hypothetical protein [uncultured Reyranella sp.]
MKTTTLAGLAALGVLTAGASTVLAQTANLTFDRAAYVTCREAHTLPPDQRVSLAVFLAEHAARHRGVSIPDGEMGAQLAHLVRGGCTLSPDAYLFTVIDRAVAVESSRLPKR